MAFLDSLRAAFKGGGGRRVPLARSFTSPWSWAIAPAGTRLPFEYRSAVTRAYVDNPVAQRAVRLVAEGVGSAPLAPTDKAALALVAATSAGQSLLETLAAQLLPRSNGQDMRYRGGWQRPDTPTEPSGGATIDAEARAAIAGLIDALIASGVLAPG